MKVILYMRNFRSVKLKEVWNYEPMPGLDKTRKQDYADIVLLSEISWNIGSRENKYELNGIMQSTYKNVASDVDRLYKAELLRKPSNDEMLRSKTVAELKRIASENNIKSSIKKELLLQEILNLPNISLILERI